MVDDEMVVHGGLVLLLALLAGIDVGSAASGAGAFRAGCDGCSRDPPVAH
ncbi:hypothetical protein [Actinoallomurus liliacearum]